METNKVFSINVEWETKNPNDAGRVGAMYCFKRCDVNVN